MRIDELNYLGQKGTIYDVIDSKLHLFGGDYSTANLVNSMLLMGDQKIYLNEYIKIFNESIATLREAISVETAQKGNLAEKFSKEEEEKLLERFQSLNIINSNIPAYMSVEEYLQYGATLGDITNPAIRPFVNAVIREGINASTKDYDRTVRSRLLLTAYLPKARDIAKRNVDPEQAKADSDELLSIQNLVMNAGRLGEYDDILKSMKDRIGVYSKKAAEAIACEAKRTRAIKTVVEPTLSADKKKILNKEGLNFPSLLFGHAGEKPKYNDFDWDISLYKNPRLILLERVNYSEDGEADQQVVAVSYGKFSYGTLFQKDGNPTQTSELMELVGITRIGEDGQKEYFVLVPFSNSKYLKDGKFDLTAYEEEEKKTPVFKSVKTMNGFDYYDLDFDKIPEDQRAFYASTYFSDVYLRSVIESNHRFAGLLIADENGLHIEASDSYIGNDLDLEAAHYAEEYSAHDYHFLPLKKESFFNLKTSQLAIVKDVLDRQKRLGEEDKKLEGEDKGDR